MKTQEKINFFVSVMNSRYNTGQSLKTIYDDIIQAHGTVNGPVLFSEFVIRNKKNDTFISEFNSTSF